MIKETAEYILTMADGSQIKFESDLPAKHFELFLKENDNQFTIEKFIAFVESFKKTIFKYSLHLL